MDTNTSVDNLQALENTLRSNCNGQIAQADAIALAISQLKGILVTQLSSLTSEQITSFPEVKDIIALKDTALADKATETKRADDAEKAASDSITLINEKDARIAVLEESMPPVEVTPAQTDQVAL